MRIGGKDSVVDNAHTGGCFVGIHEDGSFGHKVFDQYGRCRTVFNNIDFTVDYKYPIGIMLSSSPNLLANIYRTID